MDNMKKSMKYALIFGLCGSVVIPIIYEIYANISKDGAVVLFAVYILFAGAKFSSLKAKEALLGMVTTIAYCIGMCVPAFLLIHPAIKSMLEKRSQYFELSYTEQFGFAARILLVFLLMFLVWCARAGITKAVAKFRSNSEKTGDYIDNAFDDTKNSEESSL